MSQGHLKFTPDTPTFPADLFLDQPNDDGSVANVVNVLFRKAVMDFGRIDQQHRRYANFFLKSYQSLDQVADVGNFFDLDADQIAAVGHGTNVMSFLNVITHPATDADNTPSLEGGTAYPGPSTGVNGHPDTPGVSFADPITLWNKKVEEFQHNLNVGADGSIPAPPAA